MYIADYAGEVTLYGVVYVSMMLAKRYFILTVASSIVPVINRFMRTY